jgi:hypothetical protein
MLKWVTSVVSSVSEEECFVSRLPVLLVVLGEAPEVSESGRAWYSSPVVMCILGRVHIGKE